MRPFIFNNATLRSQVKLHLYAINC